MIAIDGPAGSGKSTVARALARQLGFTYLDSGAMYRAVALLAMQLHTSLDDGDALASIAHGMRLEFHDLGRDRQQVIVDGDDVTDRIRQPDVSRAASKVARHPQLREQLVERQRKLIATGDHVAEGRDIGTVVATDADLKVFLTADEEIRARRRSEELAHRGLHVEADEVLAAIGRRDRQDEKRQASPLKRADDAVEIDTTSSSVDEVVERIVALVESTEAGTTGE